MDRRNTLLIGSDRDSNRIALRELFENYYHLLEASSAEQALLLLQQNHSMISCVLLDIDHEWVETCKLLEMANASADLAEIPVIILLPSGIDADKAVLLDTCAAEVLFKPYPDRILAHRVRTFIGLYQDRAILREKLEEKSRLLQFSNDQMMDALSNIIEQRSLESGQHIQRIRGFTRILLEEIAGSWPEYGLDQKTIERMASASALHDIGKISIPDAILNKPGYLTKDEFEIMQTHTVNGYQILGQLKGVADEEYLRYACNICRYHHERWDGRGYPDGLRRDEIPICAQAAGVADVYDALTTDRVYKAAYHSERAAGMILNGECGVFSPKVLESFKACFPRFVELEQYYKDKNIYEHKTNTGRDDGAEPAKVGESAAGRLQAKYQALLNYQKATVLEADLVTGIFHLIYNPNPDYRVPESAKNFFAFANQVAEEQIHPDDRERYIAEVQHCHSALFELGQRRHSVYARMKGAATGRYRPYAFSTIRIDSDDPKAREVLLVCRPLDDIVPAVAGFDQKDRLEENPQIQAAFLNNLLFLRHDASLSIAGDIGALWELSGYSRQEIAEKFQGSLMALVHPEDREALAQGIEEQLAVGIAVNADFRIDTKNGSAVWVLGRLYLYTDADGEEFFCALLQDNTKIHAGLERLREAAAYREVFLRQSGEITFVWEMAAQEFIFDEKWEQRFGYSPCDARFDGKLEGAYHLHPDDLPAMNAFLEKLRSGGPYAEADVRILCARGGYLWNRFRAGVVCDAGGRAVRAVGSILDIDSLKQEELATILNNQDIWAYVIDENYCIQFFNEKMRAFVPAGREKQHCYEVFMRRSQPCPNCPAVNIKEKITAGADMENTYLNLRLHVAATAIRWKGRNATLIRCTDAGNARQLSETAPKPNPFRTALHPEVLQHTGAIDRGAPEILMASLQALMDHLPGMIFVKDLDLTYRAGNQAFAKMAGRALAEEVIGKTDSEIFEDQKLAQRYTSDDRKLLSGGKNLVDYVEPGADENGEARYITTSKYILTSEGGSPVGLLGLSRDITREMRSRYRYEKEVDYLFALPRDVFAARLIDIDDWRIVGQRAKPINGIALPDYTSVEHMLEDVKSGLHDESAKDALYFYEEFSPMQLRNLHNSGQSQIEMEHIFHFRNGSSSWVRNEIKFLTNPSDGHRCIMSVVRDIDSSRKSADEIARAASTDSLTGVLSRGAGIKRMEAYLAGEGKDGTHAMFMIDLDNFKSVNDLFGHLAGDRLLCDLAETISGCFRAGDLIIRMGGDEFLAFVKNIPTNNDVQKKAEKLLQAVRRVRVADTDAMISTSVGISLYPENGVTPEALFVKADEALYRAKKSGKNQAAFASDEHVLFDGGRIAMRYEDYNSLAADHADIICYISDLETNELLHMNYAAMAAYGIASPEGYQGRKCYEVLYGRSTPCTFCPNDKLQEGEPYEWIHENEALGKNFRIIDRKVSINGRRCRLEVAREVTVHGSP